MTNRLSNLIKAHASAISNSVGMTKFGTVTSVNTENSTARVLIQPESVLSGWLPVMSPWIGNGWGLSCPPSPGDQVLVVPQEGDVEQGVIVGRAFSQKQVAPNAPSGEFWLVHQSGTTIRLCNDGTVQISGDLHVAGDIYDQHGPLSQFRAHYNEHTHISEPGGPTSTPSPQD